MSGHGHAHAHSHSDGLKDLEQPLMDQGHGHNCAGHDHGTGHGHSHGHDEGHCHGHSHGHEHGDGISGDKHKLRKAVYFVLFFMLVEIAGGIIANSLAIITDAAHMLSDMGGFVISLIGLELAEMAATHEYSYGFKQAEVLGAFFSILVVWALTAILLWEAVQRMIEPQEVNAPVMFVISVIGFLVNLGLMKVLGHSHGGGGCNHGHSHGEDGLAVQAALAHAIGDMVQSLGVCLAAVLIWVQPVELGYTDKGVSYWNYADPLCTVLFGILVLLTTKNTIANVVNSLMVRSPEHINQADLIKQLTEIPNVNSVHDLHVWTMGSSDVLCTAHVMVEAPEYSTSALIKATKIAQKMGIGHTTFQIEIVGEFDPSLESYGSLHANPISKPELVSGESCSGGHDHGHSHDSRHGTGHGGGGGHGHTGGHGNGHDDGCCGHGHQEEAHSHGHDSADQGHSH